MDSSLLTVTLRNMSSKAMAFLFPEDGDEGEVSAPSSASKLRRRGSSRRATLNVLAEENQDQDRVVRKGRGGRGRSLGGAGDGGVMALIDEEEVEKSRAKATPKRSKRRPSTLPKVAEEEEEEGEDKENRSKTANATTPSWPRRNKHEKNESKVGEDENEVTRSSRRNKRAKDESETGEDETEVTRSSRRNKRVLDEYRSRKYGLKDFEIKVQRTPVKSAGIRDELYMSDLGSPYEREEEVEILENKSEEDGGRPKRARRVVRKVNLVDAPSSTDDDDDEDFVKDKSDGDEEYVPSAGDASLHDAILSEDDDFDDGFISAPKTPNKVFTFYSKSELRRSKKRHDVMLDTPSPAKRARGASRRQSTAFSPMVRGSKTEPRLGNRARRSLAMGKKETPKRAKRPPPPPTSRGRVSSKKRVIDSESGRQRSARRSLGLFGHGDDGDRRERDPFKLGSDSVNPMQEAQARLHVSAVPDELPCREDKFAEIYGFVSSKVREEGGGCIYVSGVPGTGKTATVKEVIRRMQEEVVEGELEDFTFVEINGMRLTEPSQAYSALWRALTGSKVTSAHARDLLEERFTRNGGAEATVLLVDELDKLWNRKQSVLYNLFDWPTLPGSRLVVVAVANTMDLPEKMLMNRVASRLGLTRCQFPPYTHAQLSRIVSARLAGMSGRVFDADAVELVARKVASLSGDARRALDICRRATEIAQREIEAGIVVRSPPTTKNKPNNKRKRGRKSDQNQDDQQEQEHGLVTIDHVFKAHEEMFSSPRVTAIRNCSAYERLFLRSIVSCFHRTGFEETTFDRVFGCLNEQLLLQRKVAVSTSEALDICMGLAAYRLILADGGRCGPNLRIWLNVSTDDVIFALDSIDNNDKN